MNQKPCQPNDMKCLEKKKDLQDKTQQKLLLKKRILSTRQEDSISSPFDDHMQGIFPGQTQSNPGFNYIPLGIPQFDRSEKLMKDKFFLQEKLRDLTKELRKMKSQKRKLQQEVKDVKQVQKPKFEMKNFEALKKQVQD